MFQQTCQRVGVRKVKVGAQHRRAFLFAEGEQQPSWILEETTVWMNGHIVLLMV